MVLDGPAVIVALLTPFDDDGRLDETALREHVDYLVDEGVHGLMPCGSTGETALLSDDEVTQVVRATVAAANGRVPVLAHVGRAGTATTLALARHALADGAAAVSAVVPYYYPLSQDQIRAHFGALVEGLPGEDLYAYTVPVNAHNELEPPLLERLIADGVSGAKDSTKSLERHREYAAVVRQAGDGFQLFVGTASLVLDSLREGSAGAVLAIANLRPDLCVRLAHAYAEGREDEGERLQRELAELEAGLAREAVLPALKRAVSERLREQRGASFGRELRSPLGTAAVSVPG